MDKRKIIKIILSFLFFISFLTLTYASTYKVLPDEEIYNLEQMWSNKLSDSYSSISYCNESIDNYNERYPNKSRSICFQSSNDNKFYYIICDWQDSCGDETNFINNINWNLSNLNYR